MAAWADLESAIGTALTAAGFSVAPVREVGLLLASGLGELVSIQLLATQGGPADGSGLVIDRHQVDVGVLVSAYPQSGHGAGLDAARTIQRALDSSAALASVSAHAIPVDVTVARRPDTEVYEVSARFDVLHANST
jgi:hypothetical protein